MHVPRRIQRTDPMEDMHGQLRVARAGRRGRLGGVPARRLGASPWRAQPPWRRPERRPLRRPYVAAAGRSKTRASSIHIKRDCGAAGAAMTTSKVDFIPALSAGIEFRQVQWRSG